MSVARIPVALAVACARIECSYQKKSPLSQGAFSIQISGCINAASQAAFDLPDQSFELLIGVLGGDGATDLIIELVSWWVFAGRLL